ncbi:MAG: glycosyltransferase [Exiguobacterium sp.]|nr:glycosyltransferase [Exiguobacterium sp.]
MKLQILIPQYRENDDVVKPLLDSIAIQQNVDFNEVGVIIVNDGSDVHLSDELIRRYPFEIQYVLAKHGGVSATRNEALDRSTAEYVMFCDADDMFENVCALWVIFREMEGGGFDSLVSSFIEETRIDGKPSYITREMDSTFVHGKVHRRQYLIDQHIRWNPELTIHEDSFFNIQCLNLTPKVKYCKQPFYLWRWRDDSVCRRDPKYILKTYNNMIDSNNALVAEFEKRRQIEKARFYVCFMIFDAYYLMNKPEWVNQENREYRDATERRFADYYRKHKRLWDEETDQVKMQISQGVRGRSVNEGMMMESQTINRWLAHVEQLGGLNA